MKSIITALCLLFCLHVFSQTTYYVNDDATGAGDGSSWVNAFTKLQDALAKAVSGDQIWVAEGVYYPDEGVGFTDNNRAHSFFLKSGVGIYGGFAGTETNLSQRNWQTHVTILNGDIDQDGTKTNNAYHVVQGDGVHNNPILDGFTITGGYANGNVVFDLQGGGITNLFSEPVISNCIITGNNAELRGGGVYNEDSFPKFINCKISGNTSEALNYIFYGGLGGGVVNFYSRASFTDCIISNNVSLNIGGGIYNYNCPSLQFTNCIISENYVRNGVGGGISNIGGSNNFVNCIISGNIANNSAGGAAFNTGGSPRYINCSFIGNSAADGGSIFVNEQSSPVLTNCIIWGNPLDPALFLDFGNSHTTITYSIVQGGYTGTGNLDQDPLFVDAANGDLHLQKGSPAIDKGLNSTNTTTQDLDGKPRIVNGIIDMVASMTSSVVYPD